MFYTYALYSTKDKRFYVGCTQDLKVRFKEHCCGQVSSTKARRPLKILYYEVCLDRRDALRRERYLKTAYGKH